MSQEERLMILQMVADKKISATEAAELLKALDGDRATLASATAPRSVSPVPPVPPTPPTPPSPEGDGWLGPMIENIVKRITDAVPNLSDPKHEFPTEWTGEFAGSEVPVRIATGNGRVELVAWDQPTYKATVRVEVRAKTEAEARELAERAYTAKFDETGVEVNDHKMSHHDVTVHVSLMLPRDKAYKVEGKTGNGQLKLENLRVIDSRLTSGNGKIRAHGVSADRLHLRSGNGSVEVDGDVAELEAGTGNGSITVVPSGARGQNLRVSTGNGSVRVHTRRLSNEVGLKVDAHTGMGGVTIDLPNLTYERDVRTMGHKHVVARNARYGEAPAAVSIVARTGLGSVSVD